MYPLLFVFFTKNSLTFQIHEVSFLHQMTPIRCRGEKGTK